MLPDTTERVDSVAWAADNKTLFYSTEDAITKRSNLVYLHVLGADAKVDPVVFNEKDERFDVYVDRTRDGIIECKWFVRRGQIQWQQIPAVQEVVAQLGPRLEYYRRPSTLAFRVNRTSIFGGSGYGDQRLLRDDDGADDGRK